MSKEWKAEIQLFEICTVAAAPFVRMLAQWRRSGGGQPLAAAIVLPLKTSQFSYRDCLTIS